MKVLSNHPENEDLLLTLLVKSFPNREEVRPQRKLSMDHLYHRVLIRTLTASGMYKCYYTSEWLFLRAHLESYVKGKRFNRTSHSEYDDLVDKGCVRLFRMSLVLLIMT